jgi:hypothetical protein
LKNIEFEREKLPEIVHVKLSTIDDNYKIAVISNNIQLILVYLSERTDPEKFSLGKYLFTYVKTDNKYIYNSVIYSEEEVLKILDLLVFT